MFLVTDPIIHPMVYQIAELYIVLLSELGSIILNMFHYYQYESSKLYIFGDTYTSSGEPIMPIASHPCHQ